MATPGVDLIVNAILATFAAKLAKHLQRVLLPRISEFYRHAAQLGEPSSQKAAAEQWRAVQRAARLAGSSYPYNCG